MFLKDSYAYLDCIYLIWNTVKVYITCKYSKKLQYYKNIITM